MEKTSIWNDKNESNSYFYVWETDLYLYIFNG